MSGLRRPSGWRWLKAFALTMAVVVALTPPAGAATDADFPRPVTVPLRASFRMFAEGKTLGETVTSFRKRTGLRVWLDRRVDPSQRLSTEGYGPTAGEVLEQIAEEFGLELGLADEVVVLGPAPRPERAATEMMAAWDSLVASPSATVPRRTPRLAEPRAVRWPFLTTPSEALRVVADSWDLQVDGVVLPHDLWPEVDLGEVRVTTALGLIGAGFDLAFDIDPATRRVTARSLRSTPRVERQYPGRTLPPPLRSELTGERLGGRLRKQNDRWVLSGPARAHALLEATLAENRDAAAGASAKSGGAASDSKRYSLRLVNKPADEFLRALCQSAGWRLEIAPEAAEPLAERIDLEVQQATLDELVERVVAPLGLRAERDGDQLRIVPTSPSRK